MRRHDCQCGGSGCGCCEGIAPLTPTRIENRPGLPALSYRVGTHGRFLASMKARLSTMEVVAPGSDQQTLQSFRPLLPLTTRDSADPAIALLDAWATVSDVLTFYQERIANEGYLRTASERRSLVELARLVGYTPRPGVSASVYLSYTVDDNQAEPVELPAGTRAQSIPGPDELPQSFETDESLQARREWNDLQIRRQRPQAIDIDNVIALDRLYVAGVDTGVQAGDLLLFQFGDPGPAVQHQVRRVSAVEADFTAQRSSIMLQPLSTALPQALTLLIGLIGELEWLQSQGKGDATAIANAEGLLSAIRMGAPYWPLPKWSDELVDGVKGESTAAIGKFGKEIAKVLLPLSAVLPQATALLIGLIDELEWLQSQGKGDATALASAKSLLSAIKRGAPVWPLQDWGDELNAGVEGESISAIEKFGKQIVELNPSASTPATSSPDRFVDRLLLKPVVQAANTLRLRRDLERAFDHGADVQPQLITEFAPRLKDSYYDAWRGTQVPTDNPYQHLSAVYVLGPGETLFGAGAARPMPAITRNTVPPVQDWDDWRYADDETQSNAFLGKTYPLLTAGDLVLAARPATAASGKLPRYEILRIASARTGPRSAYGMSAETTEVEFGENGKPTLWRTVTVNEKERAEISELRRTWLHPQRRKLELTQEPILSHVAGAELELGPLHGQLKSGRWVIVEGERSDIEGVRGVRASELMMVSGLRHGYDRDLPGDPPHTTLRLATELAHTYYRDGLRIHANVVPASHGESRREVLGSSDARRPLQRFKLHHTPLTWRPAPTAAGAGSTLRVLVNDVEWQEVDSLAGLPPDARVFATVTDDKALASVVFGDGIQGMRPPSGFENLRAEYRSGIGNAGNVRAGQIALMVTRPLGVKDVVNPLRSSGGADRETLELIRENAPRSLMALDRLVSLSDYADFTRMFAGIAKAEATRLGDGTHELVHISVAGIDDMPLEENSDLYRNLLQALRRLGDPGLAVEVAMRERIVLVLQAKLRLAPGYRWETVATIVRERLLERFGFDARALAQPALLCEVVAAMQSVRGVDWVDVDSFGGIPETEIDRQSGNRRLITQGGITRTVARILRGDDDSGIGKDITATARETIPPPSRVDAEPARREGDRILPAQLACFIPAVPDTLILNPVE